MSEYAQRFNLSTSLAASITRLSSWLSAILLVGILAVVSQSTHVLTGVQAAVATVPVPDLLNSIRWPLLAFSLVAAAAMLLSIPVSGGLAKKSLSQGPQRPQRITNDPGSAMADSQQSSDAVSSGAINSGARSAGSDGKTDPSRAEREASVNGPQMGPAEQPEEETISEPSTLPSNHSFTSSPDNEPQKLSDIVDDNECESTATKQEASDMPGVSMADGQHLSDSQAPDVVESSDAASARKKGFFRDIGSECMPGGGQRRLTLKPKLRHVGFYKPVHQLKRQRPMQSLLNTSLQHDTVVYRQTMLAL